MTAEVAQWLLKRRVAVSQNDVAQSRLQTVGDQFLTIAFVSTALVAWMPAALVCLVGYSTRACVTFKQCCILSCQCLHTEYVEVQKLNAEDRAVAAAASSPQFPPMMYRLCPTRLAACSYRGGGCFASDCMGSTQDPVTGTACTACCKLVDCCVRCAFGVPAGLGDRLPLAAGWRGDAVSERGVPSPLGMPLLTGSSL